MNRAVARAFSTSSSKSAGPLGALYRTVFAKSATYAGAILATAIVVDSFYSGFGNTMWEAANNGVSHGGGRGGGGP